MPARVIVQQEFATETRFYDVEAGTNLADWLMENLDPPTLSTLRVCEVWGDEIPVGEVPLRVLKDLEVIQVMYAPRGGVVEAVTKVIAAPFKLVFKGIEAILSPFLPDTETPDVNEYEDDQPSPNNITRGQRNRIRTGARIPDILGKVRSYPDLLVNSYDLWYGRRQVLYEYFCVGVGYYDFSDARIGDQYVDDLLGITVDYYDPYTRPPSTKGGDGLFSGLLSVKENTNVSDLSLRATNELTVDDTVTLYAPTQKIYFASVEPDPPVYIQIKENTASNADNEKFYYITAVTTETNPESELEEYCCTISEDTPISSTEVLVSAEIPAFGLDPARWVADTIVGSANVSIGSYNNGWNQLVVGQLYHLSWADDRPYRLQSKQKNFVGASGEWFYYSVWEDEDGNDPGFDGGVNGYPHAIGQGYASRLAQELLTNSPTDSESNWTEWFGTNVCGCSGTKEIWLDFQFPRGLYRQEAGKAKQQNFVTVVIQIEQLYSGGNPTGKVEEIQHRWQLNTVDSWRETMRFATADFENVAKNKNYRVRCRRYTPKTPDTETWVYVDDVEWQALRWASNVTTTDFGEVSTVFVTTESNSLSAAIQNRQFNVLAQRRLPTYDTAFSSWENADPPYAPTSKWADGFVYRCKATDGGQWTDDQLDIAGIYAIQDNLDTKDGGLAGECNMTLDRIQPVEQELVTIANVVRAQPYRTGQKVYVARDEGNKTPISLFNRRNKAPREEQRVMFFSNDDYYDAVTIEWIDPNNNWKKVTYTYPEYSEALNTKRLTIPGLIHWEQVWRRCVYEWEVLKRRRDTVAISTMDDGRLVAPLDVVYNVDTLDLKDRTDGEVLGISGAQSRVLEVDQKLPYDSSGSYSVILRDLKGGEVDVIPVSNVPTKTSLLLSRDANFPTRERDEWMGTLYSYAEDSNERAKRYLVMDIEAQNESYVKLSLVPYDGNVYRGDTGPVPPQPTIKVSDI